MNRICMGLLVFLFTISSVAVASTGDGITLGEALDMSRAHSLALKKSVAEKEAAETAVKSASASRYPDINLQATALYNSEVPSLSIDIPPALSFSREMGTNDIFQTDLRLSLPLYSGGRIGNQIGIARHSLGYSEAREELTRRQNALATRLAFQKLVRSQRLVDAAESSLTRAEIIANDISQLHAAGAADSVALLEAAMAYAGAELRLSARKNAQQVAMVELATLAGFEPAKRLVAIAVLPDPISPPADDAQIVGSSRPELRAARNLIEINNRKVMIAGAGRLPVVTAFAGYSYGKPNIDPFNATWNDYYTVGVKLGWSLNLGRRTTHDRKRAEYLVLAAESSHDRISEEINKESVARLLELRLAYERYDIGRRQYKLAASGYRLASIRHREGDLSASRLLDLEASLAEAEASLAATLVEYYMAESIWLYATGSNRLEEGI